MGTRAELHEVLLDLMGSDNVYFQPPPTLSMSYPCIVYNKDDIKTHYADDSPYLHKKRYSVTVIDKDPDSAFPDAVSQLQLCKFARRYVASNLNHDVFNLFF